MVIGREVDARRAVGLHVVGRAIRVEGHGPFLLGQAWEPNDDHFVSNVTTVPEAPAARRRRFWLERTKIW